MQPRLRTCLCLGDLELPLKQRNKPFSFFESHTCVNEIVLVPPHSTRQIKRVLPSKGQHRAHGGQGRRASEPLPGGVWALEGAPCGFRRGLCQVVAEGRPGPPRGHADRDGPDPSPELSPVLQAGDGGANRCSPTSSFLLSAWLRVRGRKVPGVEGK